MAIAYANGELEIIPDECPECGADLYDSGCDALDCWGLGCQNCGWGCDLDFDPEGRCAAALAAESEEDRQARLAAELAFWMGEA